MKPRTLDSELWLPHPLDGVFRFFADATNLQKLTPTWLNFKILTPTPIRMGPGALIDYQLRLHGFPIRWQTAITAWEPPHRFVDEQRRGPYKLWVHEHRFEAKDGGTRVCDHVRYAPHGGRVVDWLFVRRDVERIFAFRREQLMRLFPESS
jgi:ligand-binding SRPBCC domain-containing protein